MKYRVKGKTTVDITIIVEAENAEETLEIAFIERFCLTHYAGTDGYKFVGVEGKNETILASRDIEYTSAEEIESDEGAEYD